MRIGHCQLEAKTGDFDANLAKVVKGLERADKERVEVVCFPECFLTGYPDTEELARQVGVRGRFAADDEAARPDAAVRGDVHRRVQRDCAGRTCTTPPSSSTRGTSWGRTASARRTCRSTSRAASSRCSSAAGVKFGVIICSDGGYIEPARILALKGARIIFAPHFNYIGKEGTDRPLPAGPGRPHRPGRRERRLLRPRQQRVLGKDAGAELRRRRLRRQLHHRPGRRDGRAQPPAPRGLHLRRHRPDARPTRAGAWAGRCGAPASSASSCSTPRAGRGNGRAPIIRRRYFSLASPSRIVEGASRETPSPAPAARPLVLVAMSAGRGEDPAPARATEKRFPPLKLPPGSRRRCSPATR